MYNLIIDLEMCNVPRDQRRRSYKYARGIFSPSAGRAEKDIAEGYKDNAEFLSIKYPKTADVFFKMSQRYVYDSDLERRRAENGYFQNLVLEIQIVEEMQRLCRL